jgi:hypothetical protein
MRRRKYLIGMGSLAAGGAAALGTGAFAVEAADRDANGTIANDADAYLSLEGGQYSTTNTGDGELDINLNRLNNNARTQLDDVFYIRNTGNGDVKVQIEDISGTAGETINGAPVTSGGGGSSDLINGPLPTLTPGDRIGVGIDITTDDTQAGAQNTVKFNVDADAT